MKGGSLAWQLFDGRGKAEGLEGHAPGVPVWGLPSVFADRLGDFTIVYQMMKLHYYPETDSHYIDLT